MRFALLSMMLLALPAAAAASFGERIAMLEGQAAAARPAAVAALLESLPDGIAPVTEDSLAHFLWFGQAGRIDLAGDMTAWQPSLPLRRIAGTDLWHLAWPCPPDTRVDYKFVKDGGLWLMDPLNPRSLRGGFGPNSELAMPGWPGAPEAAAVGLPPASIHRFANLESPELGNARELRVLLPPGYDPARPRPGLIVHDGLEYLELGALAQVMAWLAVHEPELTLPVCVCLPPVARTEEYAGSSRRDFIRFVLDRVLPCVEARYAIAPGRSWGSLGASSGGNISLELAAAAPERFGRVLAMSPYISREAAQAFHALGETAPRLYLNWGRYDLPLLIPPIEAFLARLEAEGIPHLAERFNDGHSWGLWRSTLDDGLRHLYGPGR